MLKEMNTNTEISALLKAAKDFEDDCSSKSKQCKFWSNYLTIISMIKNLVRSDRDGDFLLHIKSIQDLCLVFLGGDRINYLRYA